MEKTGEDTLKRMVLLTQTGNSPLTRGVELSNLWGFQKRRKTKWKKGTDKMESSSKRGGRKRKRKWGSFQWGGGQRGEREKLALDPEFLKGGRMVYLKKDPAGGVSE